eukprot:scaffold1014_cov260-Pinguiococcus_pyrenoidosus.AAC.16
MQQASTTCGKDLLLFDAVVDVVVLRTSISKTRVHASSARQDLCHREVRPRSGSVQIVGVKHSERLRAFDVPHVQRAVAGQDPPRIVKEIDRVDRFLVPSILRGQPRRMVTKAPHTDDAAGRARC